MAAGLSLLTESGDLVVNAKVVALAEGVAEELMAEGQIDRLLEEREGGIRKEDDPEAYEKQKLRLTAYVLHMAGLYCG